MQLQDNAPVDAALLHAREDRIDVLELVPREMGGYGAVAGEVQASSRS